ncbi:hypothetical protein ETU08_03385 [Apibacter muscae]|uniref:Uncharacterized protein n=1 Tax=Apibacter muscae TaxID=2509004 RepID=A0A563DID2_9FLAO|nr:hypothetical protein [Apibacter muscae]TWP29910.1 hypothetical protein ETU09_02705 [Apibacter muscae]TWP31064.1 hypothetical protein ETU08_03385 [Apibacter muscae]
MKNTLLLYFFSIPLLLISQVGIETDKPEATLDINGDLIIRKAEYAIDYHDKGFYNIVTDSTGKIYKDDFIPSSYSYYLGFDPMASNHTEELPTPLVPGYITTIYGVSVGACHGNVVEFTLTYKGIDLLSANIHRFSAENRDGTEVVVNGGSVIIEGINESKLYSNSLENLPTPPSGCGDDYGHKLSATIVDGVKKLSVTYLDLPVYYPDAGTFTVTNVSRIKYIPTNLKK